MNMLRRNPGDPVQNLAIGKIIEVDGSRHHRGVGP